MRSERLHDHTGTSRQPASLGGGTLQPESGSVHPIPTGVRDVRHSKRVRAVLLIAASFALGACASSNILHEYDYRNRTLSVVSDVPVRPEVLSSPVFLGELSGDPVRDLLRAGARVVREVEADAVQDRLDAASERIDVGYVLEDNALDRSARYLGADPAPGDRDGDFVMELMVIEYGIDAEAWDAAAHFYIEADATLLDAGSGTEIWRAEVTARDPIGPGIFSTRSEIRDLVTAAMLATLTVDEMVTVLESLADFSARVVTDRLRDDLREARRR